MQGYQALRFHLKQSAGTSHPAQPSEPRTMPCPGDLDGTLRYDARRRTVGTAFHTRPSLRRSARPLPGHVRTARSPQDAAT